MTRRRLWLSVKRWGFMLSVAVAGAIAFEIFLSVGWHFMKSSPDPLAWFSQWFLYAAIYVAFIVLFYVAAEPFRIRAGHYRYWLLYPPLWLAVLLGVGFAALGEHYLPSMRTRVMPDWREWDIVPLPVAMVLALILRQLPWHKRQPRRTASPPATLPPTWESLQNWLQREEPIEDGTDLLNHAPIVERIYEAVTRGSNAAVALIGPVGSGKTSILNGIKLRLAEPNAPFTIVAEFNCWAMPRPEDAPRIALERAIDALDRVIDVQSIRRLPRSYQRILAAEPTGKISRILGLDDDIDAAEQLKKLSPLLDVLGAHLLIVIEDGERAGQGFETQHLEKLLWTLRRVDGVSFILSFDVNGIQFDYRKLCDTVERVPPIVSDRVEDILAPVYSHWKGDSGIPAQADPSKDRLGLESVTNPLVRYMRRRQGDKPSDAIRTLLTSPRNLKHFIREVDRAWSNLKGEIDLVDLIIITVLRHGAPEAFDFILENIELARLEKKKGDDIFESEAAKSLKERWDKLRATLPHPKEVQILVDELGLPRLSDKSSFPEAPQGIRHEEPVDYFARMLAGKTASKEVRDQDVLRDIAAWKESRSGPMIENLTRATKEDEQYVAVWEGLADSRFETDELIEIATAVIRSALKELQADAAMERLPALLAVWRRSNRRNIRDTSNGWLIEQIESALPTSLGFATDIFYYWASVNYGIVTETGRDTVRHATVARARATLTSVDVLLSSLGALDRYTITRLVFPPPTHQPPDPVPLTDWKWLVDLMIPAADKAEERIVADVAVLVGDTTGGFRRGDFVEEYRLKRDWVSQIFGDRTVEMLKLFARYEGEHKHALGAKAEAIAWLQETEKTDSVSV